MSAGNDSQDRVKAFTEFRQRMNKRILDEPNQVVRRFFALDTQTYQAGALDVKTKELIAIGIAIATRCDGCIGFHAKAAIKAGATREEILETLSMAIYMGAGPSMIYAAEALRAFDELAPSQEAQA